MPHFPAVLCCVIVLVIWIRYEIQKTRRQDKESSDSFWQTENDANFVRKKDLSSLNYIKIPVDSLPFESYKSVNPADSGLCDELFLVEERLMELSKKEIVNFTGISNTQLKLDYGAGNLEILSEYDQNFTNLVRNLNQWSGLLLKAGLIPQAKQVLEFAITVKTDITQSYVNLGNIYKDEGHPEKINRLIDRAGDLNSLSKTHIINELTEIFNRF